ncbi:MAG: hypothetical protein K0M58_09380 [Thiobacillus sp.]|nr:hypothetical protein [Thiobacillus sp.]
MAVTNLRPPSVLEYTQHPWGDLIYGTKEQLQSIGIAAGMAFPGEPNGPKRSLRVTDPRGLTAKVERSYEDAIFSVRIPFPGRDRPSFATVFAPGVKKEEFPWGDSYTGTALSLVAAGLVRHGQFPGQLGMRKTIVTILPDGSLPKGAPTAHCPEAREPGAISIYKKSKTTFEVHAILPNAEQERRRDEHSRAEREWENRMMSLPRPAPLCRPSQGRKEIEAAKKLVASWHKSPAAFRESANNSSDIILGMLEGKLLDGESGGWRYDDATAHKIERLVDQIIGLIKTGAIVEDIALKEKHTPACIAGELLVARTQYGGNVVPFRPAQTA